MYDVTFIACIRSLKWPTTQVEYAKTMPHKTNKIRLSKYTKYVCTRMIIRNQDGGQNPLSWPEKMKHLNSCILSKRALVCLYTYDFLWLIAVAWTS